jgi:S-DNA-T family DNA segregation ATPase FtsK/SpoIIIE
VVKVSIEDRISGSESNALKAMSLMPYDLKFSIIVGLSTLSLVGAIMSHKGTAVSTTNYIFCGKQIVNKKNREIKTFCDKWKKPYVFNAELTSAKLPKGAKIIEDTPATSPLQGWITLGSGLMFAGVAVLSNSIAEDRRITDPHRRIGEMRDYELSRGVAAIQVKEKSQALTQGVFTGSANSQNVLPPVSEQVNLSSEEVIRRLFSLFSNRKLDAQYYGSIDAPSFNRIKIGIGNGTKYSVLDKLSKDIKIACALRIDPLISAQAGYVAIDIAKSLADRRIIHYEDYSLKMDRERLTFAIGVDIECKLVEVDMSSPDSVCPSFLIGGTPRCGKSQLVMSFVISVMDRFTPEQVQFIIIDPKQVDFRIFENLAWVKEYKCFAEDAIEVLNDLLEESQDRYSKFAKVGARNLAEYQDMGYKMPRLVVIYDEYADHVGDKENKATLEKVLPRIAAIASAAGIHLVFSTQRPDKDVVTPLIRSNLPGRIALRTKTAADGAIIMGRECAANYLLGRGDLIYDSPEDGYVRLQSLFVGDINKVKEIVAGLSEKYPNKNIFSRTKIAEKIDREKVYNSNDIIARTKAAMTNKSRIGEGLLTVTQAQTEEEVLVVIRLALLEEQNHVLLVIKLWGNLSDYPPGNAKCLMEKYSNLLKDCIVEIEKQGFSKSNNWGFSVENI